MILLILSLNEYYTLTLQLSINIFSFNDLLKPSIQLYRQTTSKPFNLIVPPDNPFEWKAPIVGGNNTSMAEHYYLFFKPLPVGDHTIELHVIRKPLQANQPTENDVAKWNIKVVSK
jgi:hypothetical protein